jgi:hypothetical protein
MIVGADHQDQRLREVRCRWLHGFRALEGAWIFVHYWLLISLWKLLVHRVFHSFSWALGVSGTILIHYVATSCQH